MKTIKMTRTIRRELPNGWLIWIGPSGVYVRPKRQRPLFHLMWKDVVERAQFLSLTHPAVVTEPPPAEPEQVGMFPPAPDTLMNPILDPTAYKMNPIFKVPPDVEEVYSSAAEEFMDDTQ